MTDQNQQPNEQAQLIDQLRQLLQSQQAQPQTTNFGLPTGQPMGTGFAGQTPQPTGVSLPVTIPLPDGRELSARVHFGPEAVGNLQQTAALAAQMFGPYLQARNPYRGSYRGDYGRGYGYRR